MASLCLVVLSALMSVHPDNHVLVSETCEVVGISEEVEVMPILGVNLNPSVKPIQCPPGQELALLLPVSMRSDPIIMEEMNEEVNEEVATAVAMEENVGAVGGNMAGTEKAENERATGVVIVLIVLRMLHHVLLQDPNQTERQSLELHDPEKRSCRKENQMLQMMVQLLREVLQLIRLQVVPPVVVTIVGGAAIEAVEAEGIEEESATRSRFGDADAGPGWTRGAPIPAKEPSERRKGDGKTTGGAPSSASTAAPAPAQNNQNKFGLLVDEAE